MSLLRKNAIIFLQGNGIWQTSSWIEKKRFNRKAPKINITIIIFLSSNSVSQFLSNIFEAEAFAIKRALDEAISFASLGATVYIYSDARSVLH